MSEFLGGLGEGGRGNLGSGENVRGRFDAKAITLFDLKI